MIRPDAPFGGACITCPAGLTGTLVTIEDILKAEVDPETVVIPVERSQDGTFRAALPGCIVDLPGAVREEPGTPTAWGAKRKARALGSSVMSRRRPRLRTSPAFSNMHEIQFKRPASGLVSREKPAPSCRVRA